MMHLFIKQLLGQWRVAVFVFRGVFPQGKIMIKEFGVN
jgi:hypothetical protein